jgi:serine/threonine-protein kinase
MTELPVPLGTVIAGRYRVDRVLGAGSMGVVVAAFHLEFEQTVAIKFVSPAALGQVEHAERFRREVRAAAKVKSEHVARVLDVGALGNGLPYMVMELLDGRTLEEELEARRALPVAEAVGYVLQAIEALAEAHAAGIVHRDLKPANMFVSRRADRSRVIKVLDFGVSKSLGDSESTGLRLTRTGMIVGSPLYMSPEQIGAIKTADVRSDIWALGAILFELVSGRTPYNASSIADLYAMLLRDRPTHLSHYRPDIPAEFAEILARCLEREPDLRFQNVSELAEALVPFASADAHMHAARARGVLFPLAPNSEAVERQRAETEGSGEFEATEGRSADTVSSWGRRAWSEQRGALVWSVLAAMVVIGLSFLTIRLRVTSMVTPRAAAASQLEAMPAAKPAETRVQPETPLKLPPIAQPLASEVTVPNVVTKSPRAALVRAMPAPGDVEASVHLPNFGGRK